MPFYAEGTVFNATPRTVGLLFASYSVMQLIFSPILGGLSDKYGRLARAVGPFLAAILINSSVAHRGADGAPHYMSDHSLFVTFWTGAAIMFVAFLIAFWQHCNTKKHKSTKRHKTLNEF